MIFKKNDFNQMISTICLGLVIKNKDKTIINTLDKIITIIDTFCIFDTGSTDNTINLITNYFIKKGINGKIITVPSADKYSLANKNYEEAKTMANYVFVLNDDTDINIDPSFDKKQLIHDEYLAKRIDGSIIEYECCLIKSSKIATCRNDISNYWEVLTDDIHRLESVHIIHKNINDNGIEILESLRKELAEDPNNAWNQLQLANTYYSTHDLKNAVIAYKKRLKMKCSSEEMWLCNYKIGLCYIEQNTPEKAIKWLITAYNHHQERSESIYQLMKYYRITKNYNMAELFYNLGKSIKFPEKDTMCINSDIYNYLFDYESTLFKIFVADNISNSEFKIKMCKFIQNALVTCKNDAIYKNYVTSLKYYIQNLPKTREILKINDIGLQDFFSHKMNACDISLTRFKQNDINYYYAIVRYMNYAINLQDRSLDYTPSHLITKNRVIKYDNKFNIITDTIIDPVKIENERYNCLEDLKAFQHGEELVFIGASTCSKIFEGSTDACFGRYDTVNNKITYTVIESPRGKMDGEKNWVLFENDKKELKTVYRWHPIEIGVLKGTKFILEKSIATSLSFKNMSGSSPGCDDPLNPNHVWFICHFKEWNKKGFCNINYNHCFVVLDKTTYNIVKHSVPFKINGGSIEFCLGIIMEKDEIILSYTLLDVNACVTAYNRQIIESSLF